MQSHGAVLVSRVRDFNIYVPGASLSAGEEKKNEFEAQRKRERERQKKTGA